MAKKTAPSKKPEEVSNPETASHDRDDEEIAQADQTVPPAAKRQSPGRRLIAWARRNRWAAAAVAGCLLLVLLSVAWFTPLRYTLLNLVGAANVSVLVVDSKMNKPLPGAEVTLAGSTRLTDESGRADLSGLAYGRQQLVVKKPAYREYQSVVTLDWRQDDLGTVQLEPVGTPFTFQLTNSLSGQPIAGVELSYGESTALSDSAGSATLIVPPTQETEIAVSARGDGFLAAETKVRLPGSPADIQQFKLTPTGKSYFFSKRRGKIDLFSSNLDGSDQQVILSGTGHETRDVSLSISPDGKWAALVSTRAGTRMKSGDLQPDLYLINLTTNELLQVDDGASYFTIEGWSNGRVIYSLIKDQLAYDSNQRAKIKQFDPISKQIRTIGTANSVRVYAVTPQKVIYSLSEYQDGFYREQLYRVSPGARDPAKVTGDNVSYVFQVFQESPNALFVQAYGDNRTIWYRLDLQSDKLTELAGEPADKTDRHTIASVSGSKVAWVEERDGKQALFIAAADGSAQTQLVLRGSLTYPLRWLGDEYIIYRVSSQDEVADYVKALVGGEPHKITDVFTQSHQYSPYY